MTRWVLAAKVIYFLQEVAAKPVTALREVPCEFSLQFSTDGRSHASAQCCLAARRLIGRGLCAATNEVAEHTIGWLEH
jgi:hypothetical protein